MKLSKFGWFLCIVALIISTFSIVMWVQHQKREREYAELMEPAFLEEAFFSHHKEFTFVIPLDKEEKNNTKLLETIFQQKYDMYRIYLLYDENSLPFLESLKTFVAKNYKNSIVTWICANDHELTLLDYCHAIYSCADGEIIVSVEPKSWLAHAKVLDKLNEIYSISQDVWITYSDFLVFPSLEKIDITKMQRQIPLAFKEMMWAVSPVKTFYAGLLKESLQDVNIDMSKTLSLSSIGELLLVTKERAKRHTRYINEVFYLSGSVEI